MAHFLSFLFFFCLCLLGLRFYFSSFVLIFWPIFFRRGSCRCICHFWLIFFFYFFFAFLFLFIFVFLLRFFFGVHHFRPFFGGLYRPFFLFFQLFSGPWILHPCYYLFVFWLWFQDRWIGPLGCNLMNLRSRILFLIVVKNIRIGRF